MKNNTETLSKIFVIYNLKSLVNRFYSLKEDDLMILSKFEVNALNYVNIECDSITINEVEDIIIKLEEEINE